MYKHVVETGKDIHIGYTGLKAQIQKQMGRKNSKELVDLFDLLLLQEYKHAVVIF